MPRLSAEQRHRVRLTLNGRAVEGDAEPRMLLTDFLRHVLGATGTHVGCEHGVCGACTIDIDGAPGARLPHARRSGRWRDDPHRRGAGAGARPPFRAPGGVPPPPRAAMRLLHAGHPDVARHLSARHPSPSETELREFLGGHLCRCTGYVPIVAAALDAAESCGMVRVMLDLGTSFLASVARDPNALAIVDGDTRLTYRQWYERISALVAGFDELELEAGDHLVTLLQNRWEAATVHWACQFAGIIVTPINWRATAEELDYVLADAEAKALVYEEASARAVVSSKEAQHHPRISVGVPDDIPFISLVNEREPDIAPRADAEAWSVMLYTSGTTAKPKGVPRRQRAERAAALAHVAQNLYRNGERTLGAMPLYHTMGVRSLIAMSLIGGTFVCLPRFEVAQALELIEREKVTNLYLVPTLYHDLVHHERFKPESVRSVRKLGFAGASMTDGLLKKLSTEFKPELFVNHYGSSEIYTFTIDQEAPKKPGSAGRAGINQMVRVVTLGAKSPDEIAKPNEEGEIAALLAGDESFEGYWRRPDADAKALRDGWYFTGDTGYMDGDGDLFVTGRVDDMIITGGENVSPVEIESCLSLHDGVSEVAVVGLADERWGKVVTAFVKRSTPVSEDELDQYCRASGLANFKRPRRYVFVETIPKSPVGKLLRRMLVAGDYEKERNPPTGPKP